MRIGTHPPSKTAEIFSTGLRPAALICRAKISALLHSALPQYWGVSAIFFLLIRDTPHVRQTTAPVAGYPRAFFLRAIPQSSAPASRDRRRVESRDAVPARLRKRGAAGMERPPTCPRTLAGQPWRCPRLPGLCAAPTGRQPACAFSSIVWNGLRRWVLFCRRIGRPVVRVTRTGEQARRPALLTCLLHVRRGGPRHEFHQPR